MYVLHGLKEVKTILNYGMLFLFVYTVCTELKGLMTEGNKDIHQQGSVS